MTLVIALDPGQTTGVAVYNFPEGGEPEQFGVDHWTEPNKVWVQARSLAAAYTDKGYEVVLVVEQFDKRPGIVDPDYTAKYINNDLENNIHDTEIIWQIPAAAKNLVKPPSKNHKGQDQLRRFGWYKVGMRHANDASRHAIVYAVEKLKHKATILRGWPRKDDH